MSLVPQPDGTYLANGEKYYIGNANLARMVEWYLPRLKARAQGAWLARLEQIQRS